MSVRRRPLVLATASSALAGGHALPATPQGAQARHDESLSQRLAELIADPPSPWLGAAALTLRDGRVHLQAQAGWQRLDAALPEGGIRLHDRTLFRVASVTKLVVTLGVMRLVEQGRVALDEDVSAWLGWTLRHPRHPRRAITLRLLMSHCAGLSDAAGYAFAPDVALRDVLEPGRPHFGQGRAWQRDHGPGDRFEYCNLGWGLIGSVMEAAASERFDRLMHRLVLDPLGMRGGFDPSAWSAADRADVATLYRKRREEAGREIWQPEGPWVVQADDPESLRAPRLGTAVPYAPGRNGALFSPQGGLRVSLAGLGTMLEMLLAGGVHRGERFLGAASVAEIGREQWRAGRTPGDDDGGIAASWGLGAQRFTDVSGPGKGDRLVEGGGLTGWGHLGNAYGLLASCVIDPVRRHGMVTVLLGPTRDPHAARGQWSSLTRAEERLLSTVWQRMNERHRSG